MPVGLIVLICIPLLFLGYLAPVRFNHRRWTTGSFFFSGGEGDIFIRLETLTICLGNYFTFKTFPINPQSTLIYEYGLLYRQGWKRGVLVLLGSWDSPHLKFIFQLLSLFQCWMSTNERLCKRPLPLPSSKISIIVRKLIFYSTTCLLVLDPECFCMVTSSVEGHCKYRMKDSILLDYCSCIVAMTLEH